MSEYTGQINIEAIAEIPEWLQGPQGPAGPAGPQGPAGPAGKDGSGVNIVGSYNSKNELPTNTTAKGTAYLIKGQLWVYN